jgi:hypothetical protein
VQAVGTRYSTVIPAGSSWRNEKPVHVVSEKWESPELEIVVQDLNDDPRISAVHSTEEMTHLDRSEPDASVFQIPKGYTIQHRYVNEQK